MAAAAGMAPGTALAQCWVDVGQTCHVSGMASRQQSLSLQEACPATGLCNSPSATMLYILFVPAPYIPHRRINYSIL